MSEESGGLDFETRSGLMLAVFAAIMSISDLYAGAYGADEIMGTNEKAAAFSWYQSKSTKESLVEGQVELLQSMVEAGAVAEASKPAIDAQLVKAKAEADRYKKEKKEILLGSAAVGQENWIQDVDGELGKVIGAKEWEAKLDALGAMGDRFDLASLFFQLSVVAGAVSITLKGERVRQTFFWGMMVLGAIGTAISISAFGLKPV
jgi:hypothetical protein